MKVGRTCTFGLDDILHGLAMKWLPLICRYADMHVSCCKSGCIKQQDATGILLHEVVQCCAYLGRELVLSTLTFLS